MSELMDVRCAKHPEKLLGWLSVPPESRMLGAELRFDVLRLEVCNVWALPILPEDGEDWTDGPPPMRETLAVRSEYPVEVLRGIPGFKPAEGKP